MTQNVPGTFNFGDAVRTLETVYGPEAMNYIMYGLFGRGSPLLDIHLHPALLTHTCKIMLGYPLAGELETFINAHKKYFEDNLRITKEDEMRTVTEEAVDYTLTTLEAVKNRNLALTRRFGPVAVAMIHQQLFGETSPLHGKFGASANPPLFTHACQTVLESPEPARNKSLNAFFNEIAALEIANGEAITLGATGQDTRRAVVARLVNRIADNLRAAPVASDGPVSSAA